MAARTKTQVSPKYKTKYSVKNWAAYDIALRERGDITVWFDDEATHLSVHGYRIRRTRSRP